MDEARLIERDPAAMSTDQRLDYLVELGRAESWIAAQRQKTLAAIAASPSGPDGEAHKQWCREEVACALRLSFGTAALRLHLASKLVDRFPATLTLLETGAIGELHARILVEATEDLDNVVAAAVETRVLPRADGQTVAEFRRSLTRAVHSLDPAGVKDKHERAIADRRVELFPGEHGTATIWALLPADGAATVMATLTRIANAGDGDGRTADQRRADALVQLALGTTNATTDGTPGSGHPTPGQRPAVQITVALSTLLGIDEQPGELDGHGPIPAQLARAIAADPTGTWRRLVTDNHGQIIDAGTTSYRPPAALTRLVTARDQTCRMPGCSRPAITCDLDHIIAWKNGGTTNPANLHALCRRHHRAKHHAGWRVRRHRHGTTIWTSPTGRQYRKPPPELPIDHTIDRDPPDEDRSAA